MQEQCDIVNQQDQPVGVKVRSEVGAGSANTRYVNIFFRNSKGQLWIPKRRDDLKRWSSGLDFSVGGAVVAGEDYLAAAIREAREETGLDVDPEALHQVAYLSPYKFPVSSFTKAYELHIEHAPTQIASEYQSARWYGIDELLRELSTNLLPTKTDLLPIARLCYGSMRDADKGIFAP